MGDAPLLGSAAAVRKVVDVPVMATGNITPEVGERAIAAGAVDFVGMGRAPLADPDLPNKLIAGTPEAMRPCIQPTLLDTLSLLAPGPRASKQHALPVCAVTPLTFTTSQTTSVGCCGPP